MRRRKAGAWAGVTGGLEAMPLRPQKGYSPFQWLMTQEAGLLRVAEVNEQNDRLRSIPEESERFLSILLFYTFIRFMVPGGVEWG